MGLSPIAGGTRITAGDTGRRPKFTDVLAADVVARDPADRTAEAQTRAAIEADLRSKGVDRDVYVRILNRAGTQIGVCTTPPGVAPRANWWTAFPFP